MIISAAAHLAFLLLDNFSWIHDKPLMTDEWTMDADLITDLDMSAPAKTALPKAEVAPEAKAPTELLPQLPKKFSVKEETKPEEAVAEEKEKEIPKDVKPAEKEKKAEDLQIKTENKEDNPLTAAQILKAAALERLKMEDKVAKIRMIGASLPTDKRRSSMPTRSAPACGELPGPLGFLGTHWQL